ncbi:MAG: MBL fold metallo-hydrolase [Nocardioidaceae bacterium]
MSAAMRLTVVGCAGSYAGPDSPASCYLLEALEPATDPGTPARTWRVLLDLGSGAFGTLHRFVDPRSIDAVLFTHLHPDHYFDISGLYVVWKYHPDGPTAPIPVWGPPGVEAQVVRAYGLDPRSGMRAEFDFREYDAGPVEIGPFTIHATAVTHPVPAYGLRVECRGRVLAYSGDTGPSPALIELAKDADLLLCEAAFREGGDNPSELHLTGRQAGGAATQAGATRLVLTHVPAWHDKAIALAEAREAYDGPAELAATGASYEI